MKLNNANDVLAALATSKAGKDISRRMAEQPKTKDYNTPTGFLYTETQILARLKESFDRDVRTTK